MRIIKPYVPLIILAIIQIGTAIFFMLPDFIVQSIGFKTVGMELLVYKYVICSLYFSLGVLYVMGAFIEGAMMPALVIVCVDIPLEVISYWAGFSKMPLSKALIFIFSIIIVIPSIFCFFKLKDYKLEKFKVKRI